MKIVCKDNYGRDNVSDKLVAENVNKYYARRIVSLLESEEHKDSDSWFVVEEDDYKLYEWRP